MEHHRSARFLRGRKHELQPHSQLAGAGARVGKHGSPHWREQRSGILQGDEFAILLPETDESDARTVLARAKTNLAAVTLGEPIPVTATIGALTLRQPADSIENLVARADGLMYRAKQAGKNQLVLESSAD